MSDWFITKDGDKTCFALYMRHYSSRKRPSGDRQRQFVGPGEHIVLRTDAGDAVFVWRKHFDKTIPAQEGIECSLFRNEGPLRSSELIRQADAIADFAWPGQRHYIKVGAAFIRSPDHEQNREGNSGGRETRRRVREGLPDWNALYLFPDTAIQPISACSG